MGSTVLNLYKKRYMKQRKARVGIGSNMYEIQPASIGEKEENYIRSHGHRL